MQVFNSSVNCLSHPSIAVEANGVLKHFAAAQPQPHAGRLIMDVFPHDQHEPYVYVRHLLRDELTISSSDLAKS